MAGVSNSITLPTLAQKLRKMGPDLARHARKGLVEGAHFIVGQVQVEIATTQPHQPVDKGTMAQGYRAQRTEKGAKVTNAVPQALWIERGRRPGPVSAEGRKHIAEWVRRKRLYLDELARVLDDHESGVAPISAPMGVKVNDRGGFRGLKKAAIEIACQNVAYAIASTIAKKGYAPRWPLKRAIKSSERAVLGFILRAMREVRP